MGYTSTRVIILWLDPVTNEIKYATSVKLNEFNSITTNRQIPPGYILQQGKKIIHSSLMTEHIDTMDHPFIDSPEQSFTISIPPRGISIGIDL